jgi:hypothetical protein
MLSIIKKACVDKTDQMETNLTRIEYKGVDRDDSVIYLLGKLCIVHPTRLTENQGERS